MDTTQNRCEGCELFVPCDVKGHEQVGFCKLDDMFVDRDDPTCEYMMEWEDLRYERV